MAMGGSQSTQGGFSRVTVGGFKVMTSTFKPIPIVYGTNRIGGNTLWMGDIKAQNHKGGKGMGGGGAAVTVFYGSLLIALAQGEIAGLGRIWKTGTTNETLGDAVADKWALQTGALGQAPLGWMVTNHPGFALGYSGLSYVGSQGYYLGSSTQPPQFGWEIQGLFIVDAPTIQDANPADIITDMLTNTQYGVGFPAAYLGDLTTYRDYCLANGLLISTVVSQNKKITEYLRIIAEITNADFRWSGNVLEVIPYGDETLTGNGVTFTPNLAPVYHFLDADFQGPRNKDPIEVTMTPPADMFNRVEVEFLNRANGYSPEITYADLEDWVEKYGIRRAPVLQYHDICSPMTARAVAQTRLQRQLSVLNQYRFKVPFKYFLLDALDIVSINDERAGLGLGSAIVQTVGSDAGGAYVTLTAALPSIPPVGATIGDWTVNVTTQVVAPSSGANTNSKLYLASTAGISAQDVLSVAPTSVRIVSITESQSDLTLEIQGEDLGENTPELYAQQAMTPSVGGDNGAQPPSVNPPIIFEPTHGLSKSAKSAYGDLWFGVSGGNGNSGWGGCHIWYSPDGTSYTQLQEAALVATPSMMGVLLAALPAHSDPDTADTLSVDLTESAGELTAISDHLADMHQNLAWVDGELLSFASVAAGSNPYQFNCTYIRRGLYKTKIASHAIGAPFLFLNSASAVDTAIARWQYPTNLINTSVYFKFTSFNLTGGQEQSLADVPVYSFFIAGKSKRHGKKNRVADSSLKMAKAYKPTLGGGIHWSFN